MTFDIPGFLDAAPAGHVILRCSLCAQRAMCPADEAGRWTYTSCPNMRCAGRFAVAAVSEATTQPESIIARIEEHRRQQRAAGWLQLSERTLRTEAPAAGDARAAVEAEAERVLGLDEDIKAYIYVMLYNAGMRLDGALGRLRKRGWR